MKKLIVTLIPICLIAIIGIGYLFKEGYKIVFTVDGNSFSKVDDIQGYAYEPYSNKIIEVNDGNRAFIYTYDEAGVESTLTGVITTPITIDYREARLLLNIPMNARIFEEISKTRTKYNPGKLKLDKEYNMVLEGNQAGNSIDMSKFYYDIAGLIQDGEDISISLDDYYTDNYVSELEETMLNSIKEYDEFSISYSNGFDLNSKVLAKRKLITFNEDGTYNINISDSICKDICGKNLTGYNSIGLDFDFKTHDDKDIKVKSVTYGNYIDYEAESSYLMDAILNMKSESNRKPIMKQEEKFQLDDTYLEVDKTMQKVFYYEDGELKLETDVVTGLPTSKRDTPSGIYFIINKAQDVPLVGESWNVDVSYWMGVTYQGVGFHDATWRNRFGGTIYKTNGSHGCINTPFDNMKKLYDMVQVGTPVVIY